MWEMRLEDIEKLADKRMYQDKEYNENQPIAYLYVKDID